ncbi:MAG: DUF1517 domain-containing protein [Deltaproteobacteria bacterium]|nr:DUF1517 domain-containing protein [Deltaproteobacteria bacterium]
MRFVAVFSLLFLLVGGSLAEAQRRGSSFGSRSRSTSRGSSYSGSRGSSYSGSRGSSFSGSRGSSFSGSRSRSPTRSTTRFGGSRTTRGTTTSSSSGGSTSRGVASPPQDYWNVSFRGAVITIALLVFLIGGGIWAMRWFTRSVDGDRVVARPSAGEPVARSDVSALMIAFDARARSFLQPKLDAMARGAQGWEQHQLLAGVVRLLVEHRQSWVYLGAMDAIPAGLDESERIFERFTSDVRSRFRDEMVRGIDGRVQTREGAAVRPAADEGDGLCVVSVVVEARDVLADLRGLSDPNQMAAALENFARVPPAELVAFEVIWSPADDADRMSSAELEVLYPELRPVGAAEVGRVACAHCGTAYARELQWCPSCGAPPVLNPKWT